VDTGYRGEGVYKTVQYVEGEKTDKCRACRIDKKNIDTGQDSKQ
jgi:hypothetical protein